MGIYIYIYIYGIYTHTYLSKIRLQNELSTYIQVQVPALGYWSRMLSWTGYDPAETKKFVPHSLKQENVGREGSEAC